MAGVGLDVAAGEEFLFGVDWRFLAIMALIAGVGLEALKSFSLSWPLEEAVAAEVLLRFLPGLLALTAALMALFTNCSISGLSDKLDESAAAVFTDDLLALFVTSSSSSVLA